MNKINDFACVNKYSYCAPECSVLEIETEGVVCSSSADCVSVAGEQNDYTQIF